MVRGWLHPGQCPDCTLTPLPVPHTSAPSQTGGRVLLRRHPHHDPGGLIPCCTHARPWKGVLKPPRTKGQLYLQAGLSGESQSGEQPNPARWCDRSAFCPFIHQTAISGTPTMRGARASSAGLQPLAGTLAMSPEREGGTYE